MEQFLTKYRSDAGLLLGVLVVTYFLVYKTVLTPPLKPRELVFSLTAIIEIFVVLRVSALGRRPRPQFGWFFTAIVAYFVALMLLTFSIPTSPLFFREARGFVCVENFVKLYGECPVYVGRTMLMKVSFEPQRIWEEWSIDAVRYIVTALWMVLVWFTVATIAKVVKRSMPTKERSPRPKDIAGGTN